MHHPGRARVGLLADAHAGERLAVAVRLQRADDGEYHPGHAGQARGEGVGRRRIGRRSEERGRVEGGLPATGGGPLVDLGAVRSAGAGEQCGDLGDAQLEHLVGRPEGVTFGEATARLEETTPQEAGRPLVGEGPVLVPQAVGGPGVPDGVVERLPMLRRDLVAQRGDRREVRVVDGRLAARRRADGCEQHVGQLRQATILDVVPGGEPPAVLLQVRVEELARLG